MRVVGLVIVSVLLGLSLGLTLALWRAGHAGWDGDPAGPYVDYLGRGSSGAGENGVARVVVGQTEFDFGSMDVDDSCEHAFVFRNEGTGVLRLVAGPTSCGCTVSEIERPELAPGQSTRVIVRWNAGGKVGVYEQTAVVETNDPRWPRVELRVRGTITIAVGPERPKLVLSTVVATEETTAEMRVFGYVDTPLEILDYELADPSTADYFQLDWEPLGADELADVPKARSGVRLRVTIKPGLFEGPFRQTIRLHTNVPSKPVVSIPVEGRVVGEIDVVGPGWDAESRSLVLGTVAGDEGIERRLWLIARGPARHRVRFEVAEVDPPQLQVEVQADRVREVNRGRSVQTPMVVRIPPGTRAMNRLGGAQAEPGRIVLRTNHPKLPELRIPVRFAVVSQPAPAPSVGNP